MKTTLATLCLIATTTMLAPAGEVYPAKGETEIKVEAVLDEQATNSGNPTLGGEVAFGQSLYDFDLVSIFVGHRENTDFDTTLVGIQIDEHYEPLNCPVVPYLGAGAGYVWNEVQDSADLDSILLRAEAGAKYPLTDSLSLSGSVKFEWTERDAVLEDGQVDDKNWTFAVGLRYTY